ncbi:MAG: ChbG/HpnK family deacetylase [Rhodospirillaceae bacterium]|nr:ChbG/HpnK family deacetylase [Rhodospirillaceae bacterium]
MAHIVICADDYGMSEGVCDAIDTLIAEGRIHATSAMTVFPEWRQRAVSLRALADRAGADVGLHLTLTDHEPLSSPAGLISGGFLPKLTNLLQNAMLRRLPKADIALEIKAQLDAFEDAFGAAPAFVDGHQHVHILPGIRDLLIGEIRARYGQDCAMRVTVEPLGAIIRRGVAPVKAMILNALGLRHARLARAAGLACNDSFRGAYDFDVGPGYGSLFRRFLDDAGIDPHCPLIFCHPGRADAVLRSRSGLAETREHEFAYLASPAYIEDCARAGRIAARPSEVLTRIEGKIR